MSDFKKMAVVMAMAAMMGSYAAPVQAKSFLEEWFPFLFAEDEEPDSKPVGDGAQMPLQAPFIERGAVNTQESKQLGVDYKPHNALESGVALDQPHRQPAQAEAWASRIVSSALDFDSARYESQLTDISVYMTPYAIESFKAFMAKDNLLAALQSNNLVMRAFVTEPSRLLNQGAVQNRYRWLVETPVTISFLPRGTSDYAGIQPKSQRINVRLQIGRVEQGGDDGMMIETLEFLPVAAAQ